MYSPFEGGTEVILQDDGRIGQKGSLAIMAYLPPVGVGHHYNLYFDFDTGKKEVIDDTQGIAILNGTIAGPDPRLKPKECKWTRPVMPWNRKVYKKKLQEEQFKQTHDPEYVDQELEDWRQQEWDRREYGVGFWNYNPETEKVQYEYINGPNYMYLTHWALDTGYPGFRKKDQEYFFFMRHCEMNPVCAGLIEATRRRAGKTYRGGLFVYDYCSRNERVHGGIQSKTAPDAKLNVFRKAVVEPFRKLTETFKPIIDRSKGERPSNELSCFNTNRKGLHLEDQEDALESWIDWKSSEPISYDGWKLHRYLHDECFKREDSVFDLWDIIKPCLDDGNGNLVGLALFTSTVEEMNDDAMKENKKLWMKSDQSDLNEFGETDSGMFRFFVSALENINVDEYGYAPIEKNRKYFAEIRHRLRDDSRRLSKHKRKYPWKWEEAFATDSALCIYDYELLADAEVRLDVIGDNAFTRGELRFINEDDWSEGLEFYEKANGHHYHCLDADFDERELNNIRKVGTDLRPGNPLAGLGGADPFDHNIVKYGDGSMGCGTMYRMHQAGDEEDSIFSDNFIWYYLGRPPQSRQYYKEMAKMCLYLGYRILVEDNKPKMIEYFYEKGMGAYLYTLRGKKEPGISATPKNHVLLMESTEKHIIGPDPRNGVPGGAARSMFPDMIEGWKLFNPQKTTDFDLPMASGWNLVAVDDLRFRKTISEQTKSAGKQVWVKKRPLSGRSRHRGR
jgi:hypothetical protein